MTRFAIEARGLSKQYRGVRALDGLDLDVPTGAVCGFLGPNGAGKTTTMKIIMGLVRPTAGHVFVLGHEVQRAGPSARARIGYLPQDPVFPAHHTIRGLVSYSARFYPGCPRGRALRRRVDGLIERVGLDDKARRHVAALSGGERQRLGVAQALIADPDLVILDEPSAGLDPAGRRAMLELIASLSGDTTVFYSTHILDDVERVSDSVVMINRGAVVAQGPLTSILEATGQDYVVGLRGANDGLRATIEAQPWVETVTVRARGALEEWRIRVSDRSAADRQLVSMLTENGRHAIAEYHLADRRLEDAYLDLVGSGNDG